jgi:hypothetical protein
MPSTAVQEIVQVFEVSKDERIRASIDVVFDTLLEQLGPLNERGDGTSLELKIEPWPGGRWYRDLGDNNGHLWAHVQAIRKPTLLELYGPLFMSLPAVNNVQYRLTADGHDTRLEFVHRCAGPLPADMRENMEKGWAMLFERIRAAAEKA